MSDTMEHFSEGQRRELLVRFLLGEVAAEERQAVERRLREDDGWRREFQDLQDVFTFLESGREDYPPSGDLTARTLQAIAAYDDQPVTPSCTLSSRYLEASGSHYRPADMFCGIGICIALVLLFFPAVVNSRDLARQTVCQDHLRRLGMAMQVYAEHFGTAPYIPAQGPLSFAGFVPVCLRSLYLITDDATLRCPSLSGNAALWRVPTIDELLTAGPADLNCLRRRAAGDYAFTLGVVVNGRYMPARRESRRWFAWVSDAPVVLDGVTPAVHGKRGFNVLFEDGHVQLLTSYVVPGTQDHLLRNAFGRVAAGWGKDDTVLGRSEVSPLPR
jgi:prepilin-type processing-associated H-X9-DG protein